MHDDRTGVVTVAAVVESSAFFVSLTTVATAVTAALSPTPSTTMSTAAMATRRQRRIKGALRAETIHSFNGFSGRVSVLYTFAVCTMNGNFAADKSCNG